MLPFFIFPFYTRARGHTIIIPKAEVVPGNWAHAHSLCRAGGPFLLREQLSRRAGVIFIIPRPSGVWHLAVRAINAAAVDALGLCCMYIYVSEANAAGTAKRHQDFLSRASTPREIYARKRDGRGRDTYEREMGIVRLLPDGRFAERVGRVVWCASAWKCDRFSLIQGECRKFCGIARGVVSGSCWVGCID